MIGDSDDNAGVAHAHMVAFTHVDVVVVFFFYKNICTDVL